jgi:hypothetical protein
MTPGVASRLSTPLSARDKIRGDASKDCERVILVRVSADESNSLLLSTVCILMPGNTESLRAALSPAGSKFAALPAKITLLFDDDEEEEEEEEGAAVPPLRNFCIVLRPLKFLFFRR